MEWTTLQAWASISNDNNNEIHLGTLMFYESSHFQIRERCDYFFFPISKLLWKYVLKCMQVWI